MNDLRVRIRMNKLLKKMNNYFDKQSIVAGPELSKFTSSSLNLRALQALEEAGAIELNYADNEIYSICPGDHAALYGVERAELWLNRIASYIAGIFSAFAVQWLIDHL